MGFIAKTISALDLQTGVQHLTDQSRQQSVLASQLHAVSAGPLHQLGGPLAHRRLITHERETTHSRPNSLVVRSSCRTH
jgi:hypothetical protein